MMLQKTVLNSYQSGTTVFEILIAFSLMGFCLIALTKSQLFVDHGFQDLIIRSHAMNQAVNLAEVFALGHPGLQQEQDIELWQASSQAQLPDVNVAMRVEEGPFSVTMSWRGSGAYSLPCDADSCVSGENMMLQGWMADHGGG